MRLTHASVFSGIGGPEIAATMLGWDNAFHCEINEFGRKILEYWYPNSKSYEDITKTDFSEWRDRVDVLTGGFPCQPFSYAGQRRGADDDRYLWPYMYRCIDQIRPAWVVAENVAGILTMVEQGEVSPMASQASLFDEEDGVRGYRLSETFTLERICNDLESHGYSVQPILIPACAVGAPHRRDRVFIVARRVTANTESDGSNRITRSESESASRQDSKLNAESIINGGVSPRPTADSEDLQRDGSIVGHGWQPLREQMPELGNGGGTSDAIANPTCQPSQRNEFEQSKLFREKQIQLGRGNCQDCGIAGCGRWDDFPTVAPVHRGNDGLPFPLDDLAIPASKWRTESLKAYGNAIVPQVMYEIFRAIEIVEREKL